MSTGVAETLLEQWFVHTGSLVRVIPGGVNSDNQPIIKYADPEVIQDCRLQDLSIKEINSLTQLGILNVQAKLLVPMTMAVPPPQSVVTGFVTNGKGWSGVPVGLPVDSRKYIIVYAMVQRSVVDEYRQFALRRVG